MGNGKYSSGPLDLDLPLGAEDDTDGIDDAAVHNLDGSADGNGNATLYNHMKRHTHEQSSNWKAARKFPLRRHYNIFTCASRILRLADELQHATTVLNKVVQDADAQEPGLPLVFPLVVALPIPHHGSMLVYYPTSLVIDNPTPLQLENPISP
uniref:Uncharacterized protein n=1 Tax=Oryza punctata TaxID=4537 RepID=A0A0E0LJV7_ORYPU